MAKSLTEIAKKILSEEASEGANKSSLKPGSGLKEAPFSNPGAEKPSAPENEVEDLGPAAEKNTDTPPSAKASNTVSKDKSKSSQAAVSGEPTQKLDEDEDIEEDVEFEISEELQDFINQKLAEGLTEDEIADQISENFEFVAEEEDSDEAETVSEESEADYQIDMSEHVEALLSGEDLSEEFKQKATTIFESAVRQKVDEKIVALEEAYAEALTEQISLIKEELSNDVDSYLNYVVEQWVGDNELAIEASLKTELTEEFITGLRQLFAENYIDIPEEKVSVVEGMAEKLAELEGKLNEEIERNFTLNKMLNESEKANIIADLCEGLTITQTEKLKTLAEGLEYTNPKDFIPKVNILKESYFMSPASTDNVLDNNEVDNGSGLITESMGGPMEKYVRALGKTLPR